MTTLVRLEALNEAHQALLYAGDFMWTDDPRGSIRKSNILFDACVDAGMAIDEADHQEWAAVRVADWLQSR